MIIQGTQSPKYREWYDRKGVTRNNGAYWYARELEEIILPKIAADVVINTVGTPLYTATQVPDGSVIVVHDNVNPIGIYRKFLGKGCLFVCSVQSVVEKFENEGEKAVHIPLSIDTAYVAQYKKKRRTKDTAYAGNSWSYKKKFLSELPPEIDQLSGMERDDLLKAMSRYRNIIAEGRCLMEAKVLGANTTVTKFETVKTSDREVLDSRKAIPLWRSVLKAHAEKGKCIIEVIRPFNDLTAGVPRRLGDIIAVDKARAKELLNNEHKIVKEYYGQ